MPYTGTLLRHATKPDAGYLKHATDHHLSDWYREVRTGTWPKAIEPCRVMDQLYRLKDGTLLIVEAKAPSSEPGWRQAAGHGNTYALHLDEMREIVVGLWP
ncbi:hypothetical protein ABZ446_45425 [Streptomyces sp. NPDC005813]|uniref:hypothetical protein n=1 Tax=Streptomyces sp. NPDC005813 TaxID=3155592 RepID=UPI0033E93B69